MKSLIVKNPFLDPIIPKRTHWSHSSRKLFEKCKRKFYWKQILRISPRREAAPLVVSKAIHQGLAKWYGGKRTSMKKVAARITEETQKRIEQNVNFYDQDDYDELQTLLNTLTGMLMGYVEVYSEDRENWVYNKNDQEVWFQVDMGSFDYRGLIDLLPVQKSKQLVVDHKVLSNFGVSFIETLPMDGQLRSYILGATQGLKRSPKKVVYNIIRKCKLRQKSNETTEEFSERIQEDYLNRPGFYFHRETLRFSKDDIAALERDLQEVHAEFAWHVNKSDNPLEPEEWPCCSGHNCTEFFSTCPYLPLCTQGLDRGTGRLYTQYNK